MRMDAKAACAWMPQEGVYIAYAQQMVRMWVVLVR
jgi:hypothetical protein